MPTFSQRLFHAAYPPEPNRKLRATLGRLPHACGWDYVKAIHIGKCEGVKNQTELLSTCQDSHVSGPCGCDTAGIFVSDFNLKRIRSKVERLENTVDILN